MPYLGASPQVGLVTKLNDINSGFNGVTTTFQLAIPPGGVTNYFTPGSVYALFVRLGGVTQNPGVDYTVSGSQITFTTAPAAGLSCFIIAIGQAINVGVPADGSVGQSKLGTITSLPLTGATSGTTTLIAPAVAGNNTITLPTSNGVANQFLKNSGTAGAQTYSQATEDSSGVFSFNSGYGSSAPVYGCRAWVNFDGTAAGTFAGGASTVTRIAGSTTATITTTTAHNLTTGNSVYAASGVVAGTYTVTVLTSTTFTITTVATTALSAAAITFNFANIRASGNVNSVAKNGTGDYTVNFTTAMPDANFSVMGMYQQDQTNNATNTGITLNIPRYANALSAGGVRVNGNYANSLFDGTVITVSVFR